MVEKLCVEHSGHEARLINIEKENKDQWKEIQNVNNKQDKILTRMNVLLGGITVAIVLLLLNITIAKAATQTINTLPSANSTFIDDVQTFLGDEEPGRDALKANTSDIKVISGGIGSTSASLAHTISEVTAFPNGFYVNDAAISHTYTASKRTFVYVRDSDTRTISDGTNTVTYDGNFVFIETTAASEYPGPKTGTLPLFYADTSATAITTIVDYREIDKIYEPDFRAVDQGVTGDSNTLKYYIDTISTDTETILLRHNSGSATTTYTLSTSETIPSNITLKVEPGVVLSGAGTLTFAVGSGLSAGNYQIFSDTMTIPVLNGISPINPLWFGVVGDGVTDTSTEVQRAVDASELVYGLLKFPLGTFALNDILIDASMQLVGSGPGTMFKLNSDNESIFEIKNVGGQGVKSVDMHDFRLDGSSYADGTGILFSGWMGGSLYNVTGNAFAGTMLDFDLQLGAAGTPANGNCDIHNVWTGGSKTFIRLNGNGIYVSAQLFFSKVGGWCNSLDADFIDFVGNADNNSFKDVFITVGGTSRGITLNSGDASNANNVYDNIFDNVIIVCNSDAVPVVVNNTTSGSNVGPCIFTNMRTYSVTNINPTLNTGHHTEFLNCYAGGLRYEQNFLLTLTGCTTSPTAVCKYTKVNGTVTLFITGVTGTSNQTYARLTGLPDELIPIRDQYVSGVTQNNGTSAMSQIDIDSDGVIYLYNGPSGAFTNSGTKGLPFGVTLTYSLL